jgi:hypothetical protein
MPMTVLVQAALDAFVDTEPAELAQGCVLGDANFGRRRIETYLKLLSFEEKWILHSNLARLQGNEFLMSTGCSGTDGIVNVFKDI